MAQHSMVRWKDLSEGLVLAPERYDPRREALFPGVAGERPIRLGDLVMLERTTVSAKHGVIGNRRYLVLDTCDAAEGVLVGRKQPVLESGIGSAKKTMRPGDVIISRLRPYLRQVAYVDKEFIERCGGGAESDIDLIGSTEFLVLRSKDGGNIAYLSPYLLAEPVQQVLNASQEGGHHPRFSQDTLLGLPVPEELMEDREGVSASVEQAISLYRQSETLIAASITKAESALA